MTFVSFSMERPWSCPPAFAQAPLHVAHDFRLFFHGAALARTPEDKTRAVLEDLGVSTGCHKGSGGAQHARTVSHSGEPVGDPNELKIRNPPLDWESTRVGPAKTVSRRAGNPSALLI